MKKCNFLSGVVTQWRVTLQTFVFCCTRIQGTCMVVFSTTNQDIINQTIHCVKYSWPQKCMSCQIYRYFKNTYTHKLWTKMEIFISSKTNTTIISGGGKATQENSVKNKKLLNTWQNLYADTLHDKWILITVRLTSRHPLDTGSGTKSIPKVLTNKNRNITASNTVTPMDQLLPHKQRHQLAKLLVSPIHVASSS